MPTTHSDVEIIASGPYEVEEAEVAPGETIYPGMILEKTGENSDYEETPTVQRVSTIEKSHENFRIALTPDAPPRGDDADIPRQHEYEAGESIQVAVCQPGCKVQNALLANGADLATASEANVSYDDALASNDDGGLKNATGTDDALCRAREAVDNSAGAGSEGPGDMSRINVEVI